LRIYLFKTYGLHIKGVEYTPSESCVCHLQVPT